MIKIILFLVFFSGCASVRCPGDQVMIDGKCYTPGMYYWEKVK